MATSIHPHRSKRCQGAGGQAVPLFIVGLQKSGTSLLKRCLQMDDAVSSPFAGEGNDFWGNVPPFSPAAYPTGTLYQARDGAHGHWLDATDIDEGIITTMRSRWDALPRHTPIILNKNPYNTLRLTWLRALFPEARIVATLRDPVANTYSLTKKYAPHEGSGTAPEAGWWGIKPPNWRSLIDEDKVRQCARQWEAVNRVLLEHARLVDLFVLYDQFCQHPGVWLARILQLCQPERVHEPPKVPTLRNCDDEFRSGARLRSNNRYFGERGDLSLPSVNAKELPPFTGRQIDGVKALTFPLWRQLRQRALASAPGGSEGTLV